MYLYLALYYLTTTLSITTSYVLLAANTEDLRSIAKQFVPDSMAHNIFEMVKEAVGTDNKPLNLVPEFRDEEIDNERGTDYPTTSESKVIVRSGVKNKPKNDEEKSKIKYEVNLNELVEQVKQKLKSDLTILATTNDDMMITKKYSQSIKEDDYYNDRPRHNENINKYETSNKKEVASPKRQSRLKPDLKTTRKTPKKPRQIHSEENIHRNKKGSDTTFETTTKASRFEGFNMLHVNKSSKGHISSDMDDSIETKTKITKPQTIQQNPYIQTKHSTVQKKKKVKEYVDYEEETTNYNKKKRFLTKENNDMKYPKDNVKRLVNKTEPRIQPYLEKKYIEDENKGRTGAISDNDYPNSRYDTPHVEKLKENKGKNFKKPQHNTVKPKKEYKKPSPSYLNKQPSAVKYRQAPIPEEDWMPDHFDNMN